MTANINKIPIVDFKEIKQKGDIEKEVHYEPYNHRNVDRPTTNTETFLHLLKGSMGTGILSMPLAFYHSGYLVGIMGTLIIGCICTYSVHLIIRAEYELCKRRKVGSLTYNGIIEAALEDGPKLFQKLAPYSGKAVNFFLITYQLGSCCVYTVFIATNIKDVADQHMTQLKIEFWMTIILLPLFFINYIRNLKYLAPLSTAANFITLCSFSIILYYLIQEHIHFDNRQASGKLADFPLYLGTVLFALEAIGVIIPLENEMKTPKHFGTPCGVLNLAMILIVILYVGTGLLGYLAYGPLVKETLSLNLKKTEILAQIAKLGLALAIFISHPLQMYVAIDIIWNQYLLNLKAVLKNKLIWEYCLRTGLVFITFALAVAIPRLDLFISLFGTFCLSALGLTFPALIDLSTYWYNYIGFRKFQMLLRDGFLIIFGFIALIIGTTISIKNIIESF